MKAPDDVDRMIAWLEQHRAEIVRLGFGSVTFDLGGGEIKAKLLRSEKLPPPDRLAS